MKAGVSTGLDISTCEARRQSYYDTRSGLYQFAGYYAYFKNMEEDVSLLSIMMTVRL